MHLTEEDNVNKNVKKRDKKSKKKPLSRGNILSITQIGVAILIGFITIMIMKNISNTANLLYIQSDIQNRTDAVLTIDEDLRAEAIIALLTAYEFACQQYLKRNVDRKAFKNLYSDRLSYTFNRYEGKIRSGDCLSIREVIKQWQ